MATFEDGDLPFPYLDVPAVIGRRLRAGAPIRARVTGALHRGPGASVAVRLGDGGLRTVVSAHLDTKVTTPGALDDAGGVATLLALAETGLPDRPLELVWFDGEDHYAAPGEQAWLAATQDWDGIGQMLNLDGVGARGRGTTVAPLACPDHVVTRLHGMLAERRGWRVGEPWYESDHAVFAMRGVPSLALTSDDADTLSARILHTSADTLARVDPATLVDVASFVRAWLREPAPPARTG